MIRFFTFLLVVLGLAWLFAWVADNPGTVFLQWEWLAAKLGNPGQEVGIPLILAITVLIIVVFVIMLVGSMLRGIVGMPAFVSNFFQNRKREKGYRALSKGLIAASAGDLDMARRLTKESNRLLPNDPLVSLLGTQTALLEGNRDDARENFKKMLQNDETRTVALRGLFLEAERQNQDKAARYYAEEAAREAPSLPWAGNAKLQYQAIDEDWDSAIQTLESNRSAGLVDRQAAKRQRAVLLTAKAMSIEQADPDRCRKLTKEAHKLAKDLVPAATTYARAATRQGDIKGASKILEACWKQGPHPELAEAYATVRTGDSVLDRLARAKKLAELVTNHPEGNLAVAQACIDAKQWDEARKALEPVLTTRPTGRAYLLMADIEEGQNGDQGRMRDWLARAVRAPADEVWIADGQVSDEWLPVSPVSGKIDAFEWKVPVGQLGGDTTPVMTLEELQEQAKPIMPPADEKIETEPEDSNTTVDVKPVEVEDAEVIEMATAEDKKTEKPESEKSEETQTDDEKNAVQTSSSETADKVSDKAASDAADMDKASSAEQSNSGEKDEEKDKEPEKANDSKVSGNKVDATEKDDAVQPTKFVPEEKKYAAKLEQIEGIELKENTGANGHSSNMEKDENPKPGQSSSASTPYSNTLKEPLDRRPDDPGPHPDKEPPKKGFKLF